MFRRLPDAEMEVLACLSRLREATTAEVRTELMELRPMTHASVLTLLNRLEGKGLVVKEKGRVGKAFVYRASTSAASTFGQTIDQLVARVFAGDSTALVASLFETRPPKPRELARLRALVDELEDELETGNSEPETSGVE